MEYTHPYSYAKFVTFIFAPPGISFESQYVTSC